MGIQGDPNSARRLGVEGREDSTSTRSYFAARNVGPRPMEKAAEIVSRRGVSQRRPSVDVGLEDGIVIG
jgi:hypothetical protein